MKGDREAVPDLKIKSLLRDLFDSQPFAVLATQEAGQPYLSLMAFAATPDLAFLILATDRQTRKYVNLATDPRVALLMDNRTNTARDTEAAVAVTAIGRAAEAPPEEREELLSLFLKKHPHLRAFATSPTCALITVRVATYYVVQRFQEVQEVRMG